MLSGGARDPGRPALSQRSTGLWRVSGRKNPEEIKLKDICKRSTESFSTSLFYLVNV